MLQFSWMIVTTVVLGSVLGAVVDNNSERVKKLSPTLQPYLFSGGPAPKIYSTNAEEPDLMAREGVLRIFRIGGEICFDPYLHFGHQQVILNCPVIGTDYITETAPVIRTWSKVTEEGTEHVLFSAPDAENPVPNFLDINSISYFEDLLLGEGSVSLAFGIINEKYMIKPHSLIFSVNLTDLDPDDTAFSTWKCTVSNSGGSDSALTTLSICNDTALPIPIECESEGDIRLVGGSSTAGRVEVCIDHYWGTICDTDWDIKEAEVICRQLGLPYRGAVPVRSAGFGEGTGPIYFDALYCKGCEAGPYTCDFKVQRYSTCTHGQDAGVICPDFNIDLPCSDDDVRLVDGNCTAGRVEVCMNSTWGTVCDDFWDEEDVKVVCKQLGIPVLRPTTASYGPGKGQILLDDVQCSGTESSLFSCPHSGLGIHNCDHSEDAGAVCQSVHDSPPIEQCSDGDIRLSDGNATAGRVEICKNGSWGTICDDQWDDIDAKVVCKQLGLPGGIAYVRAYFGSGSGPILLDEVACAGYEDTLLNCSHQDIHDCYHSEDASVVCSVTRDRCSSSDQTQCPSGRCIPRIWICDGDRDCPSGWDEEYCPTATVVLTRYEASIFEGKAQTYSFCLKVQNISDPQFVEVFGKVNFKSHSERGVREGSDFLPFDGDITFSGNYTYEDTVCSAEVHVSAPEDYLVEQTEVFSVEFGVTSGNIIMDDNDFSFFIIDNDYLWISFDHSVYKVQETDSDIAIQVQIVAKEDGSGPKITVPFGVRVSTHSRSATEGGDYKQLVTTIYFRPDGPSYAEVRIAILNDLLPESDEHFVVELTTFDLSVILVNKVAEIWIIDDEIMTCPHLEKLKNGSISYSSVEVGSNATYKCDEGFIISGADTRTCLPSGSWSGVPPTCLKIKTCTVEQVGAIHLEGSTATIAFKGVGSEITGYTCKLDGVILPVCSSPMKLSVLPPGRHRLRVVPHGCDSYDGTTIRFTI